MKTLQFPIEETEWLYGPDFVYHEYGDCKRHVSLLFPHRWEWKTEEKFPVILFIPGSAWFKQEMYNSVPQYTRLAERGYVVAILQYRESELAKFPAQIEDVSNALEYLETLAEQFHMDMKHVFLAGNSSGGHVALMSTLFNAHGKCRPFVKPTGVIVESSPTDLLLCAKDPLPPWMEKQPTKELLGLDRLEGNEQLVKEASCAMYITKEVELPPVLLLHGTADDIVSIENSRILYRQFLECGKQTEYYEIEGAGHGGAPFWQKEVLDVIDEFCKGTVG